ncbi:hypothetical protein OSB04_001661 [Centaurea solstitialis]|uniref:Integrase catalytic domain-containing protein n=1 Tax=Centaurea solstitialis TaxID=347529 RepID=A0AA38TRF8_9ASTR|nr:hypothetical protein OSB04_001661 [Centaurea solstitialis]
MANTVTNTNNLSLRSILEKDKLTGANFLDWKRNLMIVLRHERKWYVLEEPLGEAPPAGSAPNVRNAYRKHTDDLLDVGCLMLATMSPDLQIGLINTNSCDIIRQLRDMLQTQARTERYDASRALNACKMAKGTSLATNTILNSLLKTIELSMGTKTKDVLMVKNGEAKKKRGHGNTSKGKGQVQATLSAPRVYDNGKGKGKGNSDRDSQDLVSVWYVDQTKTQQTYHEKGSTWKGLNMPNDIMDVNEPRKDLRISLRWNRLPYVGDHGSRTPKGYGKPCGVRHGQPAKGHVPAAGQLERLGFPISQELATDFILSSLSNLYKPFVLNYQMNNLEKSIMELHGMLKTAESNMAKSKPAAPVLAIREGGIKKKKAAPVKGKGKGKDIGGEPVLSIWRSLKSSKLMEHQLQGLKRSRKVRRGELDLIMGNKQIASVDMIGNYELSFSSGLSVVLIDCCYSAEMARNIISFYALYKDGFDFRFDNGSILVYKNNVLYFKANPCHGINETSIIVRDNRSSIYNVESTQSKNGLDKSYLWHCRLGHISKKRITKLQLDGILESFDHTSNDECESCLLGKMTKASFTGTCERGKDLLDIVHTDVCGPFRSATRHGERYFVTFTDDFSRYGYVYLIKHKSKTIEVFRTFQNEVENQLNRKIKTLRSDMGGEYLSQEFQDHLRSCGIVAQLTPPRTPQHNGVAERRNRTLLDMVRSMMSRTALPISFWGYALETAARVLNLVPTKKVSKTPSEIWSGEVPSLAYLKVWGCEAYRTKCLLLEGHGFLKGNLISKETSGSQIDLEEIQESTSVETDVGTSSQQHVVEPTVVEPQQRVTQESDIQPPPVRRSDRVRHAPERYNLLISDGDDTQVDLDEPASYQEAMAGLEAAKWKEAMESEMQSMYDNQVWDLVDHIPSLKIVGHKWVFKKKTDMDGKVHTYKARLVAKGYTQTHGVDYDETFSPVAMLKSIRILIAIAAFHDYEIWQMDVKTAFLNGKLSEDVYMTQPEGFVQSEHPNRVCKLQKSIYGLKQDSRSWNICFNEKIKELGFLRSEDEPCVYVRTSGSIVVFLVLYVDDILLMGNDIPTLQSVKTWLGKCFSMKDMGDAAYILGIKIYRDRSRRLIGLSQSTYIDKVLKKFNMQDSKKGFIPMQHGLALSKA